MSNILNHKLIVLSMILLGVIILGYSFFYNENPRMEKIILGIVFILVGIGTFIKLRGE